MNGTATPQGAFKAYNKQYFRKELWNAKVQFEAKFARIPVFISINFPGILALFFSQCNLDYSTKRMHLPNNVIKKAECSPNLDIPSMIMFMIICLVVSLF